MAHGELMQASVSFGTFNFHFTILFELYRQQPSARQRELNFSGPLRCVCGMASEWSHYGYAHIADSGIEFMLPYLMLLCLELSGMLKRGKGYRPYQWPVTPVLLYCRAFGSTQYFAVLLRTAHIAVKYTYIYTRILMCVQYL